jgi:hypothetical protein
MVAKTADRSVAVMVGYLECPWVAWRAGWKAGWKAVLMAGN